MSGSVFGEGCFSGDLVFAGFGVVRLRVWI